MGGVERNQVTVAQFLAKLDADERRGGCACRNGCGARFLAVFSAITSGFARLQFFQGLVLVFLEPVGACCTRFMSAYGAAVSDG